jgi:hypothetical protein
MNNAIGIMAIIAITLGFALSCGKSKDESAAPTAASKAEALQLATITKDNAAVLAGTPAMSVVSALAMSSSLGSSLTPFVVVGNGCPNLTCSGDSCNLLTDSKAVAGEKINFNATYDFGSGCTTPAMPGMTLSGSVVVSFSTSGYKTAGNFSWNLKNFGTEVVVQGQTQKTVINGNVSANWNFGPVTIKVAIATSGTAEAEITGTLKIIASQTGGPTVYIQDITTSTKAADEFGHLDAEIISDSKGDTDPLNDVKSLSGSGIYGNSVLGKVKYTVNAVQTLGACQYNPVSGSIAVTDTGAGAGVKFHSTCDGSADLEIGGTSAGNLPVAITGFLPIR